MHYARGLIPRSAYVRGCIEAIMAGDDLRTISVQVDGVDVGRAPSPRQPGPNVENIRSSSRVKRGIEPRPKGGK